MRKYALMWKTLKAELRQDREVAIERLIAADAEGVPRCQGYIRQCDITIEAMQKIEQADHFGTLQEQNNGRDDTDDDGDTAPAAA